LSTIKAKYIQELKQSSKLIEQYWMRTCVH